MAASEPRVNIQSRLPHLSMAIFIPPTGNGEIQFSNGEWNFGHRAHFRLANSRLISTVTSEIQSVSHCKLRVPHISESMGLYLRACITSGAKQQRDNPVQSLQIRYTLPTIGNDDQKVLHDRHLYRTSCQ